MGEEREGRLIRKEKMRCNREKILILKIYGARRRAKVRERREIKNERGQD